MGIYCDGLPLFYDIAGHWAQGYINAAREHGWITGYGSDYGYFMPGRHITRAEAAALINRMLGRLPHGPEVLLPEMRVFSDNMDSGIWYFLYIQEAANSHSYVMDGSYEIWVELIYPERPWHLLERPYSRPWDILR